MKRQRFVCFITGILATLLVPSALSGQQEEVRVVKPYTPTLSGAEKIQVLPDMDEEIEYDPPSFEYRLYPKKYDSKYRVEPIRAARMVKMPLKKLYKSQLTAGIGNYLTPLAELKISQLRSRNGTMGLNLKHHSMNGRLKLDNGMKTDAGFNENSAEFYGSRFLSNAVFDYRAGASYNSYLHYGVNPDLDSVLIREESLHPYFTAEGGLGIHSAHADSFHFNYDASLDYYYFTHDFDLAEHGAEAGFEFDKRLRALDIAADAGAEYYYSHWSPDSLQTPRKPLFVSLEPHIAMGSSEWRFTAGFNAYSTFLPGDMTFHFYPRGTFQFNIVKEVIVPYFGVDGFLESNMSRQVTRENPYVVPGLAVRPTSHKLIAYMGLKGRFSEALAWNLKGSYSIIDDQYFFVNDTSSELLNQFTVLYDDLTLLNLHGEFTIRPGEDWKVFLKGNYYQYTLVREDRPWNKPAFDISLQARYNLGDKILAEAGIFAIGKRYYKIPGSPDETGTLPLTLDANLAVEYRYSNLLSFWIRFNNLAAQKYYLYHQYPSYRFRVMLGFGYSL